MADHRVATGIALEEGAEEKVAGGRVGIVLSHVDLPADHIALGFEVIGREAGKKDQLDEDLEKGVEGLARTIDVVDGPVEAGVGVPLASGRIDPGGKFVAGKGPGPLEDHVFQQMGEPAPGEGSLVLASRLDPELGGQDRCGVVLVEDGGETVGAGVERGAGEGKLHGVSVRFPGGVQGTTGRRKRSAA